jgi:hypothetical protein
LKGIIRKGMIMTIGIKRTKREIKEIVKGLGYKLLFEYYDNKGLRRVVIKNSEGYKWDGQLCNLMNRNREIRFFDKRNPYILENISLWLKLNHPKFKLCGGNIYVGNNKKLKFFHNIPQCQEEFHMRWANIYQGQGCPVCDGRQIGKRTSLAYLRPDLVEEWHPNNKKRPEEVVCGHHSKVYWICSNQKCKYGENFEWESSPNSRTNGKGKGCPACAGRVVTDRNRLSVTHPEIADEWDYEKNDDTPDDVSYGKNGRRWWICPKGHSYYSYIHSRTNKKSSCEKCKNSKGESRILNWIEPNISRLKDIGIIGYIHQKKFPNCKNKNPLKFDYGFEHSDCSWRVTEFHGQQHSEPVDFAGKGRAWAERKFKMNQKHDKIKEDYCQDNNIPLLIIQYWDYDNIEKLLEKFFFG